MTDDRPYNGKCLTCRTEIVNGWCDCVEVARYEAEWDESHPMDEPTDDDMDMIHEDWTQLFGEAMA